MDHDDARTGTATSSPFSRILLQECFSAMVCYLRSVGWHAELLRKVSGHGVHKRSALHNVCRNYELI